MISRGLIISLGITTICSIVTYFYFNNRINGIEEKVDIIFKLVQNHTQENLRHTSNSSNNIGDDTEHNVQLNKPNLITISENESEEEDDDDESDSDSSNTEDEYSDDEETYKENNDTLEITQLSDANDDIKKEITDLGKINSLEKVEIKELKQEDLKSDTQNNNSDTETTNNNSKNEPKEVENKDEDNSEVDSLDELSDLDDTINLETVKSDNEDETLSTESLGENAEEEKLSAEDLKKYNMTVLKNLAKEKGLSNYKSLKKQPLINLLLEN